MAWFRKVKAGLVKEDIDSFVGEEGNIFFDVETGELRLSDGITPGGIPIGGGGGGGYVLPTASTTTKGGVKIDGTTITINNQVISGFSGNYVDLANKPVIPTSTNQLTNNSGFITLSSLTWDNITNKPSFSTVATTGSYNDLTNKPTIPNPLTISLIDSLNNITNPLTNVTAIRFDTDSGFDVTDLGSGAVKVAMNSTFKTWKVDGQQDLIATGLDTIKFVAGSGILLETDPSGSPYKTLTIKSVSKTVKLYQDGVLTATTGSIRWHNPSNIKITKMIARVADPPAVNLTINIKKTGTVVESLNILAGQIKTTEITNINMIEDDFLTVDIVLNSNGYGGRGLSVEFTYSFT